MPNCVVRQRHALAAALAIRRALYNSRYNFRSAIAPSIRCYATEPELAAQAQVVEPSPAVRNGTNSPSQLPLMPVHPLAAVTLIPRSIDDTDPERFLKRLSGLAPKDVPTNNFCVCFVTPSFASWLAQDSSFLEKVIRKRYHWAIKHSDHGLEIHALFAVVDKLPTPRAVSQHRSFAMEALARSKDATLRDTGFEGIAVSNFPLSCSVPSTSPKHPENGAIDFIIDNHTSEKGAEHVETWRLPLANTIFQTGSSSTMAYTKWNISPEKQGLSLVSRETVSHHGIAAVSLSNPMHRISALRIPLVPLTYATEIHEVMGNIVRSIRGPDGVATEAAAELEKRVPSYFKARGEAPQTTTVWALVIPESLRKVLDAHMFKRMRTKPGEEASTLNHSFEHEWSHVKPLSVLVSEALQQGARLHRVLSGGGGWGKKKGLISLDPVPTSEELPIRMEDATSGSDGPGDFLKALKPVATEGDSIQFFISPNPRAESKEEASARLMRIPRSGIWGLQLGTIPSTMDMMPGASCQHNPSEKLGIRVLPYTFGALSERGLTFTRSFRESANKPATLNSTSTVDVPFTRLWVVEPKEDGDMRQWVKAKTDARREKKKNTSMRKNEKSDNDGSFGESATSTNDMVSTKNIGSTGSNSALQETRAKLPTMREITTAESKEINHPFLDAENSPTLKGIPIRRMLVTKRDNELADPAIAFSSMNRLVKGMVRSKNQFLHKASRLKTHGALTDMQRRNLAAQIQYLSRGFPVQFENALVASATILGSHQKEFDDIMYAAKPKMPQKKVTRTLREFEKSHRSKIQGSRDLLQRRRDLLQHKQDVRQRRLANVKSYRIRLEQKQLGGRKVRENKRQLVAHKSKMKTRRRLRVRKFLLDYVSIVKQVSKTKARSAKPTRERPGFRSRRVVSSPRRLTQEGIDFRKAKKQELANAVQSWLL